MEESAYKLARFLPLMNNSIQPDLPKQNPFLLYLHNQAKSPFSGQPQLDDPQYLDLMLKTHLKDITRNLVDSFRFAHKKSNHPIQIDNTELINRKLPATLKPGRSLSSQPPLSVKSR